AAARSGPPAMALRGLVPCVALLSVPRIRSGRSGPVRLLALPPDRLARLGGLHGDLARLGRFGTRDPQSEYAVGVGGGDALQIQAVAERELTPVLAGGPLMREPLAAL